MCAGGGGGGVYMMMRVMRNDTANITKLTSASCAHNRSIAHSLAGRAAAAAAAALTDSKRLA